jgi:hypothetical protein
MLTEEATFTVNYVPDNAAWITPMIDFKGRRFEKGIILFCAYGYLAYPLSCRNLSEMMEKGGAKIDPSNIYRCFQKFTPQLVASFWKRGKSAMIFGNSQNLSAAGQFYLMAA